MKNRIYYKRISAQDSKNESAEELREKLNRQVADFRKSGGNVREIPTGVSGNPDFGVHHNKATKAKRREA